MRLGIPSRTILGSYNLMNSFSRLFGILLPCAFACLLLLQHAIAQPKVDPRFPIERKDNVYPVKQFDEFIAFKDQKNAVTNNDVEGNEDIDDITPDEALRLAYKKINDSLALDILERTRKVTPAFFEELLIELLIAMGYGGTGEGAAHALGKTGDNGIDGVIDQDPLGVDQIYIQAKRYAQGNNVGAGDIRDFFGALNLKKAQKGIFITTSDFTASAQETAQNLGTRIVLINGNELAKLMLRYNIGSRDEQVLHLKKIDEEFFEA